MPKLTNTKPETRLSIRADPNQKSILSRAATARHMNISQFVLGASLREAEQIIEEEARVVVSPEEYDWLTILMDESIPADSKPRLADAIRQNLKWDV
jgi:uncharacterized protein (DUF1778 family)